MKLIAKTLLCITLFLPLLASANVTYVNHAATGSNNGTNWQNAFTDLQDALNIAQYADSVWLAEGTYYSTNGTDRNIYFQIPNGVAIFGGFEGTETQLDQRDWEAHETILSGDIGEQGDHSDNSFTILYATQTDTTTTIDGLNIMFGNANSSIPVASSYGPTKSGGGLHLDGFGNGNQASIKIKNCNFSNNYASKYGGAIFCSGYNGSTNFIISNSTFKDNVSYGTGGAIGKIGGCNLIQDLILCTFENNFAQTIGGAYSTNDSNVDIDMNIISCNFLENSAATGGAVGRINFSNPNFNDLRVEGCLFERNESGGHGGAIVEAHISSGDIYFNNCDFIMNKAGGGGGAMLIESYDELKKLEIKNCNFFENNCNQFGGAIFTTFNLLSINNLFYKNESTFERGGAIRNDNHPYNSSTTDIINNTFVKNRAADNGAALMGGSSTKIVNSIFLENETYPPIGSDFTFFDPNYNLTIEASIFDVESCDEVVESNTLGNITCHPNVLFNIDPQFRDTANFDFSLKSCSPAINAGNTAIIDSLGILEDLAGNDRVIDGIVDIGAYEQAAFSVTLDSLKNESCFGNSNGAVYISSSGNPPFDISWQSGNDSGTNTSGLSPRVYDFIIIDADGCTDTLTVEIEAATALTTNFESNDASGSEIADGTIDFEVIAGGTPGYTYEWSTGQTTASISDLLPGNYILTVTDAISCKYGFAFTVGVTTGIDELEEEINFQIHPNPAHDFLTIELENPLSEDHQFQLFDELGRLVLKNDLPFLQTQYQISLKQIPSGFYHYFITNDLNLVKTGKLVVF